MVQWTAGVVAKCEFNRVTDSKIHDVNEFKFTKTIFLRLSCLMGGKLLLFSIFLGVSCLLCFFMQFSQAEGYQPASLQLIKEALKMNPPIQNFHVGSKSQSDGNNFRTPPD